jgi:hypothetical protein
VPADRRFSGGNSLFPTLRFGVACRYFRIGLRLFLADLGNTLAGRPQTINTAFQGFEAIDSANRGSA